MKIFYSLFALVALLSVLIAVPVNGGSAVPTPKASPTDVLKALFKALKITDVDPATCVKDVTGSGIQFRNFADEIEKDNVTQAIGSLNKALTALSSSVSGCGVQEVQTKLDAIARAIKFAHINTQGFDKVVSIIVGASDLWKDIQVLAQAAKKGDPNGIGNAIGTLLNEWTQVTGGCKSNKGCQMVDGIIRVIQQVALDIGPCEQALSPIVEHVQSIESDFAQKNYSAAVLDFKVALDTLSTALQSDSCGLKPLGALIGKLSPRLEKAIVKIEKSDAPQIIVGTANVFDAMYQAVEDLKKGDLTDFGTQVGVLLRQLRASQCQTKACIVLIGLMASIQEEASDFDTCMSDADKSWADIDRSMYEFSQKQFVAGAQNLGQGIVQLADAVGDCDVPGIGKIAQDMFTKLNDKTVANDIGKAVQLLVDGADVTHEVNKAVLDFEAENWAGFGTDLGAFAQFISDEIKCNSVACKVLEGLLNAGGVAFKDLKACEGDLKTAVAGFTSGAQLFENKKYLDAVNSWATALNTVATSVSACGVEDETKYFQQEANLLGFANISTAIGKDMQILLHGVDFYEELYAALKDIEQHDYRGAGGNLQKVMDQLSEWTKKHACTSDFCYIVVGAFQFLGDIEGSVATCKNDFESAFTDFKLAYANFSDSHHSIFHWHHNKDAIRAGMKEIGAGMKSIANGVGDCHIQEFADILEKLAIKLGIAPEVSWIEEILHIVIEGVNIEREIGSACDDFGDKNWVGFGYNVVKLVKTLLA